MKIPNRVQQIFKRHNSSDWGWKIRAFLLLFAFPLPGILINFLFLGRGLASDGAGASGHGFPLELKLQALNFGIYVIIILVFARKPLAGIFKSREENFHIEARKAEAARQQAESRRDEVQKQLKALELSRDTELARARAEAEQIKVQILKEAAELSLKLKEEAVKTTQLELQRAKIVLRDELFSQSLLMARKILSDKMQDQDQKRLQTEFVGKIQVVSQ